MAKYDERLNVHPRRYEDVVASIFKGFGYRVRVTSYSGDDGVDVFVFDGEDSGLVGVQVKRYKGKIKAAQIREFAGALVLNKVTKGIYVTTSEFTRGADNTAERYKDNGLAIQLWDAKAFYDRLQITTRSPYNSPDDTAAPFAEAWRSFEGMTEVDSFTCGYG